MEIEITGLKEIEQNLLEIGGKRALDGATRTSLRRAFKPVLESAKDLVPVDEGDLKRSLILSVKKLKNGNISARVGPDTATVVHADESGAFDLSRKKRPANYAHLVELGTSSADPKPFLRPSFDRHQEGAVDEFGESMQKSLERRIKRKAAAK